MCLAAATGPQGETGPKGETGPQGSAGTKGVMSKALVLENKIGEVNPKIKTNVQYLVCV